MSSKGFIKSYSIIRNNKAILNGEEFLKAEPEDDFATFIRSLYKKLEIAHSPFYKMDDMCKLGLMATELILKDIAIKEKYTETEIGVVLSNSSSSLQTDTSYYETVKDKNNYFPSPAVFVYTLPNIVIGEICIRNKIKGENTFFIFEEYNPEFITDYVNNLFSSGKLKSCIAGWVEFCEGKYEAFVYLAEADQGDNMITHTTEQIKKIYNF
ncbi:hypothetical protein MYP_4263 [Sporocytophaga myxococcoides]|uniref:3-oxoacyl-ACP synthase n=1 Tax=Sporocytophaga myxococcoides TaxID=153721 RepID=A0A098LLK7_9BACT|nr:hypothetical protein [Sporocytophaga myxococcoides]GAL87033.1 hypothetical protein MYP_4263 [Sporocytophaga myxococcoides]